MAKSILGRIKRKLLPGAASAKQVQVLSERNVILKDKVNELRTLYKEEVGKKSQTGGSSRLERKNALLNERVEKLKTQLLETRSKLKNVRIDQRDVSPLEHNTSAAMDDFFDNNDSEEPYENFAIALKTLMEQRNIEINGKSILDVGTGPAKMLSKLIKGTSPSKIEGLDFSKIAIEKAKEEIPSGSFKVADIYKPIRKHADLVLCTEVLEHLEKPEMALKHIVSAIAPGGIALITVPDGRIDYSLYHINFWSPESWKLFITSLESDFEIEVGQFKVTENSYYKNNFAVIKRDE